jgi:lipoprotein-anchoring transpeptidase ErfK/SrfK
VGPGSDPAAVLALQQRLSDLGYWLGTPDGGWGRVTSQAVMAFQKVEGLERDGKAGPATLERLATASRPAPAAAVDGVEIDLARQVLFVVQQGGVKWAINTSTGKAGWRTPAGDFQVQREIDGVRHAPLGDLYRPKYFTGGVAIHGSASIPGYPASHGCARVSNAAIDLLWASGLFEIGTPVRVH